MREKLGPDGSSPRCYNGSHGWWSRQSTWAAAIPDGGSIGDEINGTGFPTSTPACFRDTGDVDHPAATSSLTMAAHG
jgi:hypothetical protein